MGKRKLVKFRLPMNLVRFCSSLVLVWFFFHPQKGLAQGCSDAGFCTLNTFKPNAADTSQAFGNQLKIGAFYGLADHTITVAGNYLEYNRMLSPKWGMDVKLTTLAQSGNGISVFGLSDVFLNGNLTLRPKLKLTAGLKIPLSDAGKKKDNRFLPMDYQASLGTLDLIAGIGYELGNLQLVAALQQPLTQNKNGFLAETWPENPALRTFTSTRSFKRSGDVLLRLSYPVSLSKKWKLTPSALPIYHLAEDRYTDANQKEHTIAGSGGLTVNGTLFVDFDLSRRSHFQLNLGTPFVVRDSRPDGLTREFVANVEYRWKF